MRLFSWEEELLEECVWLLVCLVRMSSRRIFEFVFK